MQYRTVPIEAADEFMERRSRFIGAVRPVQTEEEAVAFIQQKRSDHWDATHNCYAYVLRDGQTRRYSDDGEPQGTAGVPMLEVLLREEVTDLVVVVTRYFGGILLGAGGLVRAYSKAAKLALDTSGIITMKLCAKGEMVCDYHQYGRLNSLVPQFGGFVEDSGFEENVTLRIVVPKEESGAFERELTEASCGSVTVQWTGEEYLPL